MMCRSQSNGCDNNNDTGDNDMILNDHAHEYRTDIADWWCHDCDTVTDYCDGDYSDDD